MRLIIQTIRRDPSRSGWVDSAPNLSRANPSGSDQMDAKYQATDLAVGVGPPRYLDPVWAGSHHACSALRSTSSTALSASPDVGATPQATRPLFVHTLQRQPSCLASIRAW